MRARRMSLEPMLAVKVKLEEPQHQQAMLHQRPPTGLHRQAMGHQRLHTGHQRRHTDSLRQHMGSPRPRTRMPSISSSIR